MHHQRNRFLIRASALLAAALQLGTLLPSPALAALPPAGRPSAAAGAVSITPLPALATTIAGEPLLYPSTPHPEIKSDILTIAPGGVTRWMTHPVPAYLYVLQGDLTVQFADGRQKTFHAGQAFLQCHAVWHRGVNDGQKPVRFLAVFMDAKGVPVILHPPASK